MSNEEPQILINSALENFETRPDVATIDRINDKDKHLKQKWQEEVNQREKVISKLESELKDVNAEIDALTQPTDEIFEQLHLSAEEIEHFKKHGSKITGKFDVFSLINEHTANLDNSKIALAQQLSESETTLSQLRLSEMELARREEEIVQNRASALSTNASANMNSTSMRVMLFKKFGLHIEESADGGNDKILVFSENRSDPATSLDVDPKFSDYFISNFIWDHVGGPEGG